MTIEQINKDLKWLEDNQDDDEAAHAHEDDLYFTFIAYIADGGNENLVEKAELILRSKYIDFSRWCA
jgi:hypothetical protein